MTKLHELEDFKRQQIRQSKEIIDSLKQQEECFANERLDWNNEQLTLVREIEDSRVHQRKMFDDYEFRLKILEQKLDISNVGSEEVEWETQHGQEAQKKKKQTKGRMRSVLRHGQWVQGHEKYLHSLYTKVP